MYFTAFTANLGNRLLKTSANSNLFVSVIHFLLCFSSSSSVLSVARLTDDPLTLVWQGFNYQTACTVLWPLAPSYKEQKNSSVSPWCTVSQSLTGSFVRCYIVYSICSKWIGVDLFQLAYNHTMPWMLCVLFAIGNKQQHIWSVTTVIRSSAQIPGSQMQIHLWWGMWRTAPAVWMTSLLEPWEQISWCTMATVA